jgi:hypothetical protein
MYVMTATRKVKVSAGSQKRETQQKLSIDTELIKSLIY